VILHTVHEPRYPVSIRGYGHGEEGWDDGGGGTNDADALSNGDYFYAAVSDRGMPVSRHFEVGVFVATCVSQLYLLEQVINQRADAPVQRSIAMEQNNAATNPAKKIGEPIKAIVVVEAGWVLIGEYFPATPEKRAHMTDASVIRRWGTTAGLGQIALTGPTAETVLDPCGVVVFDNPEAILFVIQCSV